MLILGFLIPSRWEVEKKYVLLGFLGFLILIWAIIAQMYFLEGGVKLAAITNLVIQSKHPLRVLWATVFTVDVLSVGLTAFLVIRFYSVRQVLNNFFGRINLLSALYVVLDFIGIVVVVMRNL